MIEEPRKTANGGSNRQQGRKTKNEEVQARGLALHAIIKKYGSLEEGLSQLLDGSDRLKQFVWEHALGKPREEVENSGAIEIQWNEVKMYSKGNRSKKV